MGPAIVRQRYFELDGSKYEPKTKSPTPVEDLVRELMPSGWKHRVARYGVPGVGGAILTGETITVMHLLIDDIDANQSGELVQSMDRLNFVVEYSDLYGNKYKFTTAAGEA